MTTGRRKPTLILFVLAGVLFAAGGLIWFGRWPGKQSDSMPNEPIGFTDQTTRDGAGKPSKLVGSIPDKSPFHFELMTPQTGIDFLYYGAPSPEKYMTDQNGGGVGLIDYDQDGQLDLFFVNGSHFKQPATGLSQSNRLYRAVGDFRYEEVTVPSQLVAHGFGMGSAVGDYDNDGFSDLFVACYGRDRMWRNNGDGTFSEVTDEAGVGSDRWGTSAAFADLDGDGLLDLYVVNYVEWSSDEPPCHPLGHPEIIASCSPIERIGQADLLYRNTGSGQFEEIGEAAGIALVPNGKGMALSIADLNGDGRLDIFIANDTSPNFLFRNLGNMRFEEVAVLEGVAVINDGTTGAGMGVGCADYDHNGYLDLAVTNFANQVNSVFANLGPAGFTATNTNLGIDLVSRAPLGFGVALADFNLDSWPDMIVANGHIWDLTSLDAKNEYHMHPQLLWNQQARHFADVSEQSGDYFRQRWLGRAAAFGDLDNDGDIDLVISHLSAPPAVLRNDCIRAGQSFRLNLIGTRSSRQTLGCQVITVADELRQVSHVPSGGSFQVSHDPRMVIATGTSKRVDEIRVTWSNGQLEIWLDQQTDVAGEITLIEGTGVTP